VARRRDSQLHQAGRRRVEGGSYDRNVDRAATTDAQRADAQEASGLDQWSSAAAALEEALGAGEDGDARFRLGVARWWLGETRAAVRAWQRGYVAYRREGRLDRATMTAFYLCLAYRMSLGNEAAARGWLARAERLVVAQGLADLRGWVLVARAHVEIDAGRPGVAESAAEEAAALAREAGDVDLELCAVSELGAALVEQGRTDAGGALLDEAMAAALAGEGRDPDAVVMISCRTITACCRAGDVRRATEWVHAAEEFRRQYGSPHLYATCRTQYGALLAATGALAEAERELAEALRIAQDAEPALHAGALAALAEVRLAQGRAAEAAALLAGFEDRPEATVALARVRVVLGEHAAAGTMLRRRLRRIDAGTLEAAGLGELLTEVEIAEGDLERAESRGRDLVESGRRAASALIVARGHRAVGRARLAAGRAGEAVAPLELAVAGFAELGMSLDAALLRSLGARAARSGPRAVEGLTPRETEVLALLGEGLSNPEIGRRLFITRKTVEHHVANVLGKLGLTGRAEAAAYAARHLARDHTWK
jgi:DNA-binding CsgD family transcriptional regulator